MRVLILGINYDPELISTALYTAGMARFLGDQGADVRVITAHPYYPDWKIFAHFKWWRYHNRREGSDIAITHCPHYVPKNPSGVKRLIHQISFALTALPVALIYGVSKRPDVVIAIAPSLLSTPVAWLAAKLGGAKTWLHIQDFEAEAAVATGLFRRGGRLASAALSFERWIIRRFDRISSISCGMVAKLDEKGIAADKTYEFRNWANLTHISPLPRSKEAKAALGITADQVVLYSGNIANKQGLEVVPRIAQNMADRADLCFVICGDGPFLPKLKQLCADLTNVVFLPLQPLEQFNQLLAMADIHLLPQIAGTGDLVLPSKLTNILASGRPVVANSAPTDPLAIEIRGCGTAVAVGDDQAMADAISQLLDDPRLWENYANSARERALENWDENQILRRFYDALLELAEKP
ncbi:glycosyltransferase WbuB [Amylibacter marinus]|uniref:Glycosyltransferase WbuB n=1 Tax=Amylibacter marinus TaxID=1475483 RepID=A0ABQ5VS97_9RHOB|nr:WcaI family glycosyltransferase [Amylibacter marinus]GLQ34007.1 glycosyltransferase WbuB [Amylibacter marinus]